MDLLNPETGTIFWTVITFILLALILKRLAWKPILKVLDDRENRIKSSLYQAEKDQQEAEKLVREQREMIEKAKKESVRIINDSRDAADNSRQDIIEQAKTEAESLLVRAKQEIDSSKEAAIADVKKYAVDISIMAAQKVIGDAISKEQQEKLIRNYLKELEVDQ